MYHYLSRFLGAVDKLGTAYVDKHIATGYGSYIAVPLLREAVESRPLMDKEQAIQLLKKSMEVLYFRDARAYNKVQLYT